MKILLTALVLLAGVSASAATCADLIPNDIPGFWACVGQNGNVKDNSVLCSDLANDPAAFFECLAQNGNSK